MCIRDRPAADKILLCLSSVLFASCKSLNSTAEKDIKAEQTRQRETATNSVFLIVSLLFIKQPFSVDVLYFSLEQNDQLMVRINLQKELQASSLLDKRG